jgi:hypothetical protein
MRIFYLASTKNMIPLIVDNFLSNELLDTFLYRSGNDYNIDSINQTTGVHFINCANLILNYNKDSKVECLINHIINFIKLNHHGIHINVTTSDLNDIKYLEYWNKHLIKKKYTDHDKLSFHFDTDEQDLLEYNKSELSIVYYFKKQYENGLLLINKTKNYFPHSDKHILYKSGHDIINDNDIINSYHIVEPRFNRLVLFNGGEYCHGITQVNSIRDSLVMNLWLKKPLNQKIVKHQKNNIFVIERVMHDVDIGRIKECMNKYCTNDGAIFELSAYVNNNRYDKEASDMDKLLFSTIHKIVNYVRIELVGDLEVSQDTGYRLINALDARKTFHACNKLVYIEFALDDVDYEFDYFDNIKVNKNSFIIVPYCWSYNFKILSDKHIMRIMTDMV